MMKLTLPYQQIQDAVCQPPSRISAAEAHGVLTGMLCVHDALDGQQWLSVLFEAGNPSQSDADIALLLDLCEQTREVLGHDDYAFEMLLPDDDTDLSERAAALAEWCQGFLYGVGYQAAQDQCWPGETDEVLRDLAEIARLEPAGDDEADEAALMEINEFVRVAVQMLRCEFNQQTQSTRIH